MAETVQKAEDVGVAGEKRGFLGKLLSMGKRSGKESVGEPEEVVVTEVDYIPLFGSGLTKDEVIELNGELQELLTELGVDPSRYFSRPLDEYASPVDLYEEIGKMLDDDGQDVDLSETLATRLGDDHPLVVELRRREALGDVKVLDDFIKSGLGPENTEKVYLKTPNDFHTPLEYYSFLQARAKENGLDLVPLIKRKLGEEHPLPKALGGDELNESFGWHSMKKPRSFAVSSTKSVPPTEPPIPEDTPKEETESKKPQAPGVIESNKPSVAEEKGNVAVDEEPDSEKGKVVVDEEPDSEMEKMVKDDDPGSENKPGVANVQESGPTTAGNNKKPDCLPVHDETAPVQAPCGCRFKNCFGMR